MSHVTIPNKLLTLCNSLVGAASPTGRTGKNKIYAAFRLIKPSSPPGGTTCQRLKNLKHFVEKLRTKMNKICPLKTQNKIIKTKIRHIAFRQVTKKNLREVRRRVGDFFFLPPPRPRKFLWFFGNFFCVGRRRKESGEKKKKRKSEGS